MHRTWIRFLPWTHVTVKHCVQVRFGSIRTLDDDVDVEETHETSIVNLVCSIELDLNRCDEQFCH